MPVSRSHGSSPHGLPHFVPPAGDVMGREAWRCECTPKNFPSFTAVLTLTLGNRSVRAAAIAFRNGAGFVCVSIICDTSRMCHSMVSQGFYFEAKISKHSHHRTELFLCLPQTWRRISSRPPFPLILGHPDPKDTNHHGYHSQAHTKPQRTLIPPDSVTLTTTATNM